MIKELNVDATLELLDEIISEFPDDHGANCYYRKVLRDGEVVPKCIVGQVVYKLGGLDALLKLEEMANADGETNSFILRWLGCTPDAVTVLQSMQVAQDTGRPWTEGIVRVRDEVANERRLGRLNG